MLFQEIKQKLTEAMKAHDELKVSTYRLLVSAFNYEQIEMRHELTDEEVLAVIKKQAKQRKDSIEALRQAQGKLTTSTPAEVESRIEQEQAELKILQEFLPPEMSEEELTKLVDEAITATGATNMSQMGIVIGKVKSIAPDADGGQIAQLVRSKLG